MNKHTAFAGSSAVLLLALSGCNPDEPAPPQTSETVFRGEIEPLNGHLASVETRGEIRLTEEDGEFTFIVEAAGVPAEIVHLQHLHTPHSGESAEAPPAAADTNGDGFIDLIETRSFSGRTTVPFHDNPASLEGLVDADRFPRANAEGTYRYEQTFSREALEAALQVQAGISGFEPTDYVFYIHGVPESAELPDSVQSLPDVPAHLTLPIGVARLRAEQ
ncbi:MAG: hypothetical protein ACLFR7_04415 [Opitutales bacterium]